MCLSLSISLSLYIYIYIAAQYVYDITHAYVHTSTVLHGQQLINKYDNIVVLVIVTVT